MPISFSPPVNRDVRARGAGVTAVLGPTNTGKTHLAIERMLAHSSGLIGLPLRLLAREVYNRAVERVGADAVALVTGEEKIKPPNPRFWVATVEAMPRDLDVAFLAIDEIQLAADFERGHVFTDRMLHRRGREETLVLGAATMKPMVERLLPGASIVSRPRLSQLTFSGEKKLTRLPRRSAIVAFSADEVYAIAELIRRQRGGAAVVLGALSPRTRNAQVELYQSGQVDYLVATDAIGMGLNLDVDHIAFASDRKFDGYQFRKLNPSELAQIAGRAGRAMRDGTFGTSGRCPPFETELVQALESHTFEPVKMVQWRNTDLDFSSVGALQATLAAAPTEMALARAPVAEDILVLDHAARDDDVRALTRTAADVERLWDVCQLPDYRKIAPANHAELAVTVYGFLQRDGTIKTDWFAHQVAFADRTDGDIDTLSTRIAHIRTWTFAANRPDWLADPEHWQGVTRGVEDRLSDALHERLTERFVDRRTSVLMRRLRENAIVRTRVQQDRRGRGRRPCHRPARWLCLRARCIRRAVRRPRRCKTPRKRRWPAKSPRARDAACRSAGRPIRARGRRHAALDRRRGRQAPGRRRRFAAARAHHRRRAFDRRAARRCRDAARRLAQIPHRKIARPIIANWRPPPTSPASPAASPFN